MKTKKAGLDIDYIGGQDSSLTQEEEKALTEFFASRKRSSDPLDSKIKVKNSRSKSLV